MEQIKNNNEYKPLNYEDKSSNNDSTVYPTTVSDGTVDELPLDSDYLKKKYNETEYAKHKGGNVKNIYIDKTIDTNYYNKKLKEELSKYNSTRYKTAAAALFLATDFPKLPYFWGGGHDYSVKNGDFNGINPNWGQYARIKYGGSEDYPVGTLKANSLDCSGYVTWCLINGGYDLDNCLNTTSCYNLGKKSAITDDDVINNIQVGDLGYTNGHVGMVVDVNEETHEVTFAHVSGSGNGMNLTTISTDTGKVTKDDLGAYASSEPIDRVGEELFNTIIYVPYED